MRLSISILLCAAALTAQAQIDLKVEAILNKPDAGGTLQVLLCPTAKAYRTGTGCATRQVPVEGRVASCIFEGILPGTYAVKAFQDLNGNGELDTSRFGWPKEPCGFSNEAPVSGGAPFRVAAFEVWEGIGTVRVVLR
ncbi:MAG TPA: DUF2141 domain-containing protein [Flavobacteriales bacterium]|nr:DUF2141 domain-containing protein [Flavobacteriales bacterium]